MDGNRPRASLTDSALDRELESALGVEPSPQFLARVRTRVAAEPTASSWRLAIRGWAVEPLWGVAVVGIVLAVVVPQLMREEPLPPRLVRTRSVETNLSATAKDESGQASRARVPAEAATVRQRPGPVLRRVETVRTVPLQLSPVLFSEDERQALIVLVTAVQEGRVPPRPAVAQAQEQSTDPGLHIAPLVIERLPLLARAPQEGEGQW